MSQVLTTGSSTHADPSAWHLLARLALLGRHVAAAVTRRRAFDADPDEAFRGLYVSEEHVDALLLGGPGFVDAAVETPGLEDVEAEADRLERAGVTLPLRTLARAFSLDERDVHLLLAVVAPEIEPRFERLYAYLQDSVTRLRPGPALALELAWGPAGPLAHRHRLGPGGALVVRHLVAFDDVDRPFLTRSLLVPDRVVAHLLGDDSPDPLVAAVTTRSERVTVDPGDELARAVSAQSPLVYACETGTAAGVPAAVGAFEAAGRAALVVDLTLAQHGDDDPALAHALALEAGLTGRGLVAGPLDALDRKPRLRRALAEATVPTVLVGTKSWDVRWSARSPLVVDVPPLGSQERARLWDAALAGSSSEDLEPGTATAQFRLTPEQIAAAAHAARARASVWGRAVTGEDLHRGARLQSSSGLERLARRIEPRAGWDDLVVSDAVAGALRDLAARARHGARVLVEWQMGARTTRGRGVVALFAGPSGTGKTLSAEVLANDLGLDLYVVDLASVVDKYIGETEKNLDRIFQEAQRVNGVLLFDEADALFGKRSGVEDARDRYANIEVAYLLQQMEAFEGIAILTTNLRGNLDDAFARRLDAVLELPLPDEDGRTRLWRLNLPPALPLAGDVDVAFLARFRLSGGNVRNACLAAAFRAAAAERDVSMADLVRGVAQEYTKLGHMCVEAEFGPYYDLVSSR